MKSIKLLLPILLILISTGLLAQNYGIINVEDDDMQAGHDIFSNFSEDVESTHVMEDERYYRYGRFFTVGIGFGLTTFTGNRGIAYEDENPTYAFSLHPFLDFNTAFGLGLEFSKHHFFIDESTHGYNGNPPGAVEVRLLRFFFDLRHYIDTADLGTAITFSNPYFVGRLEYWYQTNKFIDQTILGDESGGAFGVGIGAGLEFPMKLNESYINIEFLVHKVNFFDKYTQKYRPLATNPNGFGYEDLTGLPYTTMVSYAINW